MTVPPIMISRGETYTPPLVDTDAAVRKAITEDLVAAGGEPDHVEAFQKLILKPVEFKRDFDMQSQFDKQMAIVEINQTPVEPKRDIGAGLDRLRQSIEAGRNIELSRTGKNLRDGTQGAVAALAAIGGVTAISSASIGNTAVKLGLGVAAALLGVFGGSWVGGKLGDTLSDRIYASDKAEINQRYDNAIAAVE